MAVATAVTAINMNNWVFPDTVSLTLYDGGMNDQIEEVLSDGSHTDYYGTNLTLTMEGVITGGTLTALYHNLSGEVPQYNVTGLNHSAVTAYNYLSSDSSSVNAQILPFLFSGNDTFNGSSGNDQLNGYAGRDTMDGKGGTDRINGGAGNDVMIWGAGDTFIGSLGNDTLKILTGNVDLASTANPNNRLQTTEQIDLRTGAHTLRINASDVLDMSPSDQVKIFGDNLDTVNIVGTQVMGGDAPVGFTRYTIGDATLIISTAVEVI